MIQLWLSLSGPRRNVPRWALLITCAIASAMSGCGGSSKPVSVAVSATATTVDPTDTTTLTATVTNDKNAAGVTWSVSGGGTLSNQTTTTATYTAPAASSSSITATVTATSVASTKQTATVSITVPAALTLTTTSANLAGQVGTAYSVQLQGSGGIPPYKNWALASTSGPLPSCVTLSSAGVLASASLPTAACAGTFSNLVFTFTDSGAPTALTATTQPMSMTIAAAPAISFPAPSATEPGAGTFDAAYTASVAATGGAGALTYSLAGALPAGLSLGQSSGAITGTPTAVGTSTFAVKANDDFGDAATSPNYTIVVSYSALSVTPAAGSLPAAVVGTAYPEQALTVSGGSGSGYMWTITGLPADGLTENATGATADITGTPTAAETVSFMVSVEDSAKNTAGPYTYTIVVNNASGIGVSALQGTYACLIQGFVDSGGARFAIVTSFQADGKGNFTGGVFDANSRGYPEGTGTLTGTYTVSADGNGTATTTATTSGVPGTNSVGWAFALASSATPAAQFSLVEADDAGSSPSGQHAVGNCYLASPAAFAVSTLNGNSFVWGGAGENSVGASKAGLARVVLAASGLTVTGGSTDEATAGSSTLTQTTITGGTFTAPDPNSGRSVLSVTGVKNGTSSTSGFVLYVIDANRGLLIGTDTIGSGSGSLNAGEVRRQQQATYSDANLKGGFVFYTQALEYENGGTTPSGFYSIIYQGAGDGAGNLSIAQSYMNENGTYTAGKTMGSVPVTFDSTVPGRVTIAGGSGTIILYLFDTNSAFEMSLGGGNNPVESGRMEPQTQTTFTDAALAGAYMMTEVAPLQLAALDRIGELTVGADGSLKGRLTDGGQGDYNFDQSLTATYAWDTTATGTGTFLGTSPAAWSCAVVTSTRFVCVDQTANPAAMRIFQQ